MECQEDNMAVFDIATPVYIRHTAKMKHYSIKTATKVQVKTQFRTNVPSSTYLNHSNSSVLVRKMLVLAKIEVTIVHR